MPASYKLLVTFTLFMIATQNALADECTAQSGKTTTPLLELYTSEGCSSCPPADKWLSELPYRTNKLSRLAFHVDYWNYLGWKDRFSKEEYTARQRKTASFNHSSYVYTPQLVINGLDFKHWNNTHLDSDIKKLQESAPRANLSLSISNPANNQITATANAQLLSINDANNSELLIAVYENNLSSKIMAGENNGHELHHDYVVRVLFGPYPINNGNQLSRNITLSAEWTKRDAGIVTFVQNTQNGAILQSLQRPFCQAVPF